MIQDIYPHIYHNEYVPTAPREKDIVFAFCGQNVLVKKGLDDTGELALPEASFFQEKELQYLFRIDQTCCYLYLGSEVEIEGCEYQSSRIFRKHKPKSLCFAGMTAWHLFTWYRDHRFCGRCGSRTRPGDKERVLICPKCANHIYPMIAPAVIVGVISEDRLLVTRYKGRPYGGNALIAGFCEIGESVEDTVRREVMEEAGLAVKNLKYYKSQPWGFADNLLMGYYCEVDGGDTITLDDEELSLARWTPADEIGTEDKDLSLTADMMMHFKEAGRLVLSAADLSDTGRSPDNTERHTVIIKEKEDLADRIRHIWKEHIPGLSTRRQGESAVLLPLIFKDGEYQVLFEKRALDLEIQPGEICFPGGRLEEGEAPREAAIREAEEELLIREDQIEILAALDPSMGPSGASIWPFAAVIRDYEDTWSGDEVDHTFSVPFSVLAGSEPEVYYTELSTLPGEDFPFEMIPGGRNYPWRIKKNPVYFYTFGAEVIWGVTARILFEFLTIYKRNEI